MEHHNNLLGDLDAFITQAMQQWKIPGLAVAIVKDDAIVFAQGFGVREIDGKDPVGEHTLFAIGSNTKAFTAAALGLLVQEGKLAWDDPVVKHLPGFQLYDPYVTHALTVRDLLCHRCGLPTWGGDLVSYGSRYARDEILQRVRYIRPAFSLRSEFGYSNLMYIAAGQIIPALAQVSWDDFIQQRFFHPLNMSRSNTTIGAFAGLNNVATPHELVGDKVCPLPYRNMDNSGPAGSINSTAWDLAQWLRLQLGNGQYDGKQLVDPSVLEETRTPHTPIRFRPEIRKLHPASHFLIYGLGWTLWDYQGRLVVSHDGGLDGMLSLVGFLPEEQLGIVVLTNQLPHGFCHALFHHVVDAYLGAPKRDWNILCREFAEELAARGAQEKQRSVEGRVHGTQPTLTLRAYTGTYTSPLYGEASVGEQGDQLVLHLSAHPTITGELEHWHYDTFLCQWTDPVFAQSLVPFITNGQGKVEEFRLKVREDWIDPLEYVFTRTPEQQVQ